MPFPHSLLKSDEQPELDYILKPEIVKPENVLKTDIELKPDVQPDIVLRQNYVFPPDYVLTPDNVLPQPNPFNHNHTLSPFPSQVLPSIFRCITGVDFTYYHNLYNSIDEWIESILLSLLLVVSKNLHPSIHFFG